jgi:hypothetical protein
MRKLRMRCLLFRFADEKAGDGSRGFQKSSMRKLRMRNGCFWLRAKRFAFFGIGSSIPAKSGTSVPIRG